MLKSIIQLYLKLIITPDKGWVEIAGRQRSHQDFLNNFLYPIFGAISITTFAGAMWMGSASDLNNALKEVIVVIVSLFGGFYIASYIVGVMYLKYEQIRENELVQQFVGYSSIVVYLLYFVMPLLPGFELLWLFVVYSFYLVFYGVNVFLNIPEQYRTKFILVSAAAIVFSPFAINFLLSLLV